MHYGRKMHYGSAYCLDNCTLILLLFIPLSFQNLLISFIIYKHPFEGVRFILQKEKRKRKKKLKKKKKKKERKPPIKEIFSLLNKSIYLIQTPSIFIRLCKFGLTTGQI